MDGALITDHDQSALNRHDLRRKREKERGGERERGDGRPCHAKHGWGIKLPLNPIWHLRRI